MVVIMAGTNDIAGNTGHMTLEQIESNLSSMAESQTPRLSRRALSCGPTTRCPPVHAPNGSVATSDGLTEIGRRENR